MQQINHLNLFKKWVEINDDAPAYITKNSKLSLKLQC